MKRHADCDLPTTHGVELGMAEADVAEEEGLAMSEVVHLSWLRQTTRRRWRLACNSCKALMSLIAWNCQGLRQPQTIRALTELIRKERPSIVFLSETRLGDCRMEKLRKILGYNSSYYVNLWALQEVWGCGGVMR
ncbi:unnamed protein product [Prunus armeniaca]|uniref:Endonuclease/exonuclease/phosphatase domain-containing protein n=1 Tax=Prunus armeniaca TaxID=36596 RepID=A0A6J5VEK0_PRUAR|nr:unnamed protein product [Prunus armeniaca]